MLSGCISGCSGKRNNDGIKYLIGVSQANLSEPFQVVMNDEIKAEASKYPSVKVISYDSAGDNQKQVIDINNLQKQRVDLLIISPNDSKFITDSVAQVYKSGISVIVMGYPIENDNYSMRIYTDNKKLGKYAGEYVKELLGEKGGVVLEIQGDPDSRVSKERKEGFFDVVKNIENIKNEYVIVGYWLRDKAKERLKESAVFEKERKVDVVFAHNDSMAIGARIVAQDMKLQVNIVGIEGLPGKNGGLEAVKKGVLDATFLYPTGGKEAITYALKILDGEKVPKQLELLTKRITKENVFEFQK